MIKKDESNKLLMQYASLGAQFLVSIGLALFIGIEADRWLHISFPLLAWLLPLLVIIAVIYKILKDTSNKK